MTIREFAEIAAFHHLESCYVVLINNDGVEIEKFCGFNLENNRFYPAYGNLCLGDIDWVKFHAALKNDYFGFDDGDFEIFVKHENDEYPVFFEDFGDGFGYALEPLPI